MENSNEHVKEYKGGRCKRVPDEQIEVGEANLQVHLLVLGFLL